MDSAQRVAVVIEDDADIRALLATTLEQAGFQVVTAANGADGVEAVRVHDPVVTTLDVSLPGIDGFEAAKRIRSFSQTYLVILTARSDEIDTLQGLESGADDYVTKPFRPRELRARIEAMLRRPRMTAVPDAVAKPEEAAPGHAPTGWIERDGLRLHRARHLVYLDDAEVALTPSEFDILAELLESAGRVRSKQDLALVVRGEDFLHGELLDDTDLRTIEVHMANLRRKLGETPTNPRWIETVRGVGYRLSGR